MQGTLETLLISEEQVSVRLADGRTARVIELNSETRSVYVHYANMDRRLDEWISVDSIGHLLETVTEPPLVADVQDSEPAPEESQQGQSLEEEARGLRSKSSSMASIFSTATAATISGVIPAIATGVLATTGIVVNQYPNAYADLEKDREEQTRVRYFSPYPTRFHNIDILFTCEWCLSYYKDPLLFSKHLQSCQSRSPPGTLLYNCVHHGKNGEEDVIKIWELDGKLQKLYVQRLCLLGKLFVDHKTIFFDTDPFLFYVLTRHRKRGPEGSPLEEEKGDGDHFIGYFSKERFSFENYNLAVINILPAYQRKGYGKCNLYSFNAFQSGRLLIEWSYELSKMDCKVLLLHFTNTQIGSPELPLSDLGYAGYRSYWQAAILDTLLQNKGKTFSLQQLSLLTSIRQEDILATAADLGLLKTWSSAVEVQVDIPQLERCVAERCVRLGRSIHPEGIVQREEIAID